MRDGVALFVLAVQLPIPVFWLLVHPVANFWRRYPRGCYYGLAPLVWIVLAMALVRGRVWWLAERFSQHWLATLVGVGLLAADVALILQVERQAGWRALVGLPELMPAHHPGRLVAGGIYQRVRHPRYLGMMLAWWGAVLLSGATRLAILVAGATVLAWVVSELEERELAARFGREYVAYRERVPRFVPRWHR
ncbi:MAG: isoprenylcysteine carboxylmethyltransferase family protein [Acidobacteria bacterium]|nr:isoprenylcysteine carboxylmethyltransferase family protein [Acidobacteriota bacterium]